jgi:hypothetical protein
VGRQSKKKQTRREQRAVATAMNPLSSVGRFADAQTVFGRRMPPHELIDRIKTFDWRDSFFRLAHIAASLARDKSGPLSPQLQRWARVSISQLTGSDQSLISHARTWAASGDPSVVVHEEAIDFVQHLVLLYGLEEGDTPANPELALWLLGASDSLGAWENPDGRSLSSTEKLIAEQVRVARFNTSEDSMNLVVRIRDLFAKRPFAGKLSDQAVWEQVQQKAFGCSFVEHFETRVMPLFAETFQWGESETKLPLISAAHC